VSGSDAVRLYEGGSLPIGIEDCQYTTHLATIPDGSTLIFYTDGLIEFAHNALEGEKRLIECATDLLAHDVDGVADALLQAVLRDASPLDDVVLVAVTMMTVSSMVSRRAARDN